jgi:hypothetical protein
LLQYEKLPSEGLKSFDINEHSQMFAFDTGRSFLLGIELPPLQPPFLVRIKSFALGGHIKESQIFYPVALVLDSSHRTLSRQLPPPNMSLSAAGFSETAAENRWGLGTKYQWDLLVDDNAARYLVIYTDARLLASGAGESRRIPVFVPVSLAGFIAVVPTGQQETVIVPYSAFGRISVQAQPEHSVPGPSVKR